jgi:FixJ family two-component response regulator
VLAENACADDFLEKPFQISTLMEKINRCIKDSDTVKPVS